MFCSQCGAENGPDAKFCEKCGAALTKNQSAPNQEPAAQQPAAPRYAAQPQPQYQQPQYQAAPQPQYRQPQYQPTKPFSSHLAMAIISIFLFLPLGIIATVNASNASKFYAMGDIVTANQKADTAKLLALIGIIVGAAVWVITMIIIIVACATAASAVPYYYYY